MFSINLKRTQHTFLIIGINKEQAKNKSAKDSESTSGKLTVGLDTLHCSYHHHHHRECINNHNNLIHNENHTCKCLKIL